MHVGGIIVECVVTLSWDILHSWTVLDMVYSLPSDLSATHIVCVNLKHERRVLQFKVDSERQNFEKLFMTISFFLRVFAGSLLRGYHRRNTFFIFLFWGLTWGLLSKYSDSGFADRYFLILKSDSTNTRDDRNDSWFDFIERTGSVNEFYYDNSLHLPANVYQGTWWRIQITLHSRMI